MATVELTATNFEETVVNNDLVVVDFWAAWCGPCRTFAPIFEAVSEEFPEITFAKVDTEAEQALAANFQIMSIPTLMLIRQKVVLFSQPGAMPKDSLVDVVNQALALDMEQVHKEIADAQAPKA
jgi:thioredoxin 1